MAVNRTIESRREIQVLARAFYWQLKDRPSSVGEIMNAASEILGCLCEDLGNGKPLRNATDTTIADHDPARRAPRNPANEQAREKL